MTLSTGNKIAQKSFTLLELLLVIFIISILFGLSAPRIKKSIRNTAFKSFTNKTYLFLDYAKTASILKNIILEVVLDAESRKIFLKEKNKANENIKSVAVPEDIYLKIQKEKILFYPDGSLDAFKITLSDDRQRQAVISSQGFDGKIKIRQ